MQIQQKNNPFYIHLTSSRVVAMRRHGCMCFHIASAKRKKKQEAR